MLVVSSKSGGTVETDSQRRAYAARVPRTPGSTRPSRIVVVTDPGSPLEASARAAGYRVVLADPDVGGRYSALTAFGLVPSGLAGVDVAALLDEADGGHRPAGRGRRGQPGAGARRGARRAAPARAATGRRDKLALAADGTSIVGLRRLGRAADRREHRASRAPGCCPSSSRGRRHPRCAGRRPTSCRCCWSPRDGDPDAEPGEGDGADGRRVPTAVSVGGSLGAQLLLWEAATAVAGRLLGINPFDQPDVESAKKAARGHARGRAGRRRAGPGRRRHRGARHAGPAGRRQRPRGRGGRAARAARPGVAATSR